jgi:hypothetical protein
LSKPGHNRRIETLKSPMRAADGREGWVPIRRDDGRLGRVPSTIVRSHADVVAREGDDRRVRTVELTANGRQLAAAALPAWRKAQSAAAADLTPDVLASLHSATRILATSASALASERKRT